MAKAGEKTYFKAIGQDGMDFTLRKPFSDPGNVGSLLHDIAAVFSLMPLPPPAKVLDLGVGSGWTSSFYARAGYDVTGLDIAPEAIEAAKTYFCQPTLKLQYAVADYDNMHYSNIFDVAVFFDSLHHAEDEVVALKAAYKALKPGGYLIACEPGHGHSKSPSSIEAVAKYGVNERDMPPSLLVTQAHRVGFHDARIYAYPAMAHRALYKTYSEGIKQLFNNPLARASRAFSLALLRNQHGIVVAKKPL